METAAANAPRFTRSDSADGRETVAAQDLTSACT
ncbi:hypothetical protein DSM104299_00719 [Baekduia alba]|nr:hypothetical protein DSM104299_00719 [Baekduia alba]